MSLTDRLDVLARRLSALPAATRPPETIPRLLAGTSRERDWQRLLVYFLDPSEPHGLDHDLLELLLRDLPLTVSRLDLLDASVASEVNTDRGRPDALVWSFEEWFVLWELKVGAPEGPDQTRRYAAAETFHGVNLDPSAVSEADRAYVYLAPEE